METLEGSVNFDHELLLDISRDVTELKHKQRRTDQVINSILEFLGMYLEEPEDGGEVEEDVQDADKVLNEAKVAIKPSERDMADLQDDGSE